MSRADEIQIELLRRASPEKRLALTFALSAQVIALAQRAIERSFADLDAIARRAKFVEVHYGADLAARFEAHLRRRASTVP